LLHRGSRDSFQFDKFHLNVDGKGAHVTIVKSNNNIFGGYSDISLESKIYGYKEGNGNSFLFKLNQSKSFIVLKCIDKRCEVYHSSNLHLEAFGIEDLTISDNCNVNSSSSSILNTY
jgi:hypothetical protein